MNYNFLLSSELVDMPAPLGFDSWLTFWLMIIISAANAVLMSFAAYKFFQVSQLTSYKMKGFWKWIKEDKGAQWGRLIILSFLSSAALLITNVLLQDFFVYKIMQYFGLLFYLLFALVYIINQYSIAQKTPLKYTHRMNRMIGAYSVLVFALTMVLLSVTIVYIPYFKFGGVTVIPMFIPLIVCIAYYIMLPYETLHNRSFVKRAKKKLASHNNLIKIAITGSYAKTSVKNILTTMLSKKFNVCCSPLNYNTPLGLSKTVLEHLTVRDQVLVAEMGARYVGDIKELCDLIEPEIGLITGIGNQHLLTFKTKENLIKTKSELTDYICSKNGKMFFNAQNEESVDLFNKCSCEKVLSNPFNENDTLYAKDIEHNQMGVTFTLVYKGKEYKTRANLLGSHNVSNIILCANVCLSLGISIEQIVEAIEMLMPSPHRLALTPSANSLIVIDDAYNASVEGSRAALDVLASYKSTKVVITPGLVELGKEQFECNVEFGKAMAAVADYVIVDGTFNYQALEKGLLEGGMAADKILRAGSLKQAVTLLRDITEPGDVVLFENDLPDNYN